MKGTLMKRTSLLPAVVMLVGGVALGSCESLSEPEDDPPPYSPPTMLITGVTVSPQDRIGANVVHNDTLRARLDFRVVTHARPLDDETSDAVSGFSPLPPVIANPTIPSLSSFSFDRPIVHRGSEIAAHTNLLTIDEIVGVSLELMFPPLIPFTFRYIRLPVEEFDLTPAWYTGTFLWGTGEGEIFADTVRVYIDIW